MLSLLLVTAMSAVTDTPNTVPAATAQQAAARAYYYPVRRPDESGLQPAPHGLPGGLLQSVLPHRRRRSVLPVRPGGSVPGQLVPNRSERGLCAARPQLSGSATPCRLCPPGGRLPVCCP